VRSSGSLGQARRLGAQCRRQATLLAAKQAGGWQTQSDVTRVSKQSHT
jgi:hypothetical protein